MPFVDGDRLRLTDALLLDSRADESSGYLQTLMTQLESRSPTRVGQIQELLEKIEELKEIDEDISSNQLDSGAVASLESYLEGKVSYHQSSRAIADTIRNDKLDSLRQRIRRYLDPYGYLNRLSGVGRAIDGT
jgi:hypothetical protein